MIASFADLKPDDFNLLARELTIIVFPVGGIESHGPHLPMGVKLVHAERLTRKVCERLDSRLAHRNFLIMPTLALSVDTVTSHFAFPVRPHVVRDALVDQCEHFKRLGFKSFMVVSAHLTPRQLTAIEDASKIVSRGLWNRASMISVTSSMIESKVAFESPWIGIPDEHGGAVDTSLMLGGPASQVPASPRPKASPSRFISYLKGELNQFWGNPAQASAELYSQEVDRQSGILAERLVPWIERGEGKSQFFSPYRYFPVNGSFFKVYFLASIFFIVMMLWVLWSVKDVFEK